jgi:hypothetical protein
MVRDFDDVRAGLDLFFELVNSAADAVGPSEASAGAIDWAKTMLSRPLIQERLASLHERGANLPALLTAALQYRLAPELFTGAFQEVSSGELRLVDGTRFTAPALKRVIRSCRSLEKSGFPAGSPFPIEFLEESLDRLHKRDAKIQEQRAAGIKVRRVDPESPGGTREVSFSPKKAWMTPVQIEVEHVPDLHVQRRAQGGGRAGDLALSVLATVVAGHLNCMKIADYQSRAAVFLATIALIEPPHAKEGADWLEAHLSRIRRAWGNELFVLRASQIGPSLGLAVKLA